MTTGTYNDTPLGVECAWIASPLRSARPRRGRVAVIVVAAVAAIGLLYAGRGWFAEAATVIAQWLGFAAG